MSRVLIYPVLCLSLAVGAACSRDRGENRASIDIDKDQIEVTGCMTANPQTNQFVLTANQNALTSLTNRAGAGEAESFHYQLVGGNDLQQYVGKEVVVKGAKMGKGADVNIESKDKPAAIEPDPRNKDVTPAVESTQEIEMQIERLNVASVTPTGSACRIGHP